MAIENAKTLNVRIKNKYDSYENWAASGLVLEAGEIAVAYTTVDVEVGNGKIEKHPELLMKVGNNVDTFANLPWLSAKAADVPAYAKKSEADFKAWVKTFISIEDVDTSAFALAADLTAETNRAKAAEAQALTDAKAYTDAEITEWVGDKTVGVQISEAITGLDLANTYDAKGAAAAVQTALDTYKTSNDAAVLENKNAAAANTGAIAAIKDGTTIDSFADVESALAGKETAGAAATAEANAKAYADGLAGNYDAKGAAATAESNAKSYADGLAGNYDAKGDAAQALIDAKAYTDGEIAEWVGEKNVATQISEAIANEKLADTYAAKVHTHVKADITDFAHTHEMSEVNGLTDALAGKQAAGDYATKTEAQGYADAKDEAIAAAKKAGDDAQADVDTLEAYVGTIPEGATATNIVAYVQEKTAGIATDAALGELTNRVSAAEGAIDAIEADYLKAADKTELQGQIDDLEELVGGESVATQIEAAVAAEAEIARAAEKANADAIDAIEADYLKAADKTELQTQINTIMNNPDTEGVINSINEFTQYIADHGEIAEGFRTDIDANADAIEAIEADYLKAADKTALQDQITANDGEIAALQTAVGTKAAQADLEALAGRVTTVEGDLNTETTGLKARMTAAEADIDALETKVGDTPVADQITAAIEALKIGDYAKAADLTAAVARIAQNETDIAALEGRMDTAEGEIDALQTEIAKKANDADLAAIAKTGSTDDLVQGDLVLLFDCGTSAV